MPKTRFDKAPRDPLKELVRGVQSAQGMTVQTLASKTGMSRSRLYQLFNGHSDEWKISDVRAFSRALGIPIAEMRDYIGRS